MKSKHALLLSKLGHKKPMVTIEQVVPDEIGTAEAIRPRFPDTAGALSSEDILRSNKVVPGGISPANKVPATTIPTSEKVPYSPVMEYLKKKKGY